MTIRLLVIACLLLSLMGAVASAAPRRDRDTAREREAWQQRVREAREELADADLRQRRAFTSYGEMRHRPHMRGARKRDVLDERVAAKEALEEAQRGLDALLEEARRAGVPPGWLRDEAAYPANASGGSE